MGRWSDSPAPMFSVFRRRGPAAAEIHDPLRLPVREREALAAWIVVEGEDAAPVELLELSVAGATVRVPFAWDPHLRIDDVGVLRIESAAGTWAIQSAAQVHERRRDGENAFRYGLDFVGEGDLFAQLESAAGRWFNRRRHARARPELDHELTVQLAYKHYRSTGTISDISESGLCVVVDSMSAAPFRDGEPIQVSFELPGVKRPFEGVGVLRGQRRQRGRAYVGIEFDLDARTGLGKRHDKLAEYVEKRLAAMAAFGRALCREEAA